MGDQAWNRTWDTLNADGRRVVGTFMAAIAGIPEYQLAETLPRQKKLYLVHSQDMAHLPPALAPVREAYFSMDRSTRMLYTSKALQKWLGASADQLLGDKWHQFIDGDGELKHVLERWMVAAQMLTPFSYTTRCRTTMGEIAYAFVRVKPACHPVTGHVEHFFGTVHPQVLPVHIFDPPRRARKEATG